MFFKVALSKSVFFLKISELPVKLYSRMLWMPKFTILTAKQTNAHSSHPTCDNSYY